jgi:hypothetical protein
LILFPYLGVFAYMIFQSEGMAERATQQAQQARDELRRTVGFSVADEINKLDQLRKTGSITSDEYARLRRRSVWRVRSAKEPTTEASDGHFRLWPIADVETRFRIGPLSGVKRTCRVHVQLVCL